MSLLRKSFHIATKQLYYITVFATIVILLMMGAVVWLSNEVDKRKDEAAAWIGEQIGQPVSIEEIDVYWLDLFPKLNLHNVVIYEQTTERAITQVESLYLGLDLLASFDQQNIVVDNARLSNASIGITRTQEGEFQLAGFREQQTSSSSQLNVKSIFQLLKNFELQQFKVEYQDALHPELSGDYRLSYADYSVENDRVQAKANVNLPEKLGQNIKLTAELNLNEDGVGAWSGEVITEAFELGALSNIAAETSLVFERGQVSANVTVQGEQQTLNASSGNFVISDVQLVSSAAEHTATINGLSSHFDWQQSQEKQTLKLANFDLSINGEQRPSAQYQIIKTVEGDVIVDGSYLNLNDVTALGFLHEKTAEFIQTQKPAGELNAVHVEYSQQALTHVSARFNDIVIEKSEQIPGITGLSGNLNWQDSNGHIAFNSQNTTVYPSSLYKEALFFDSISGNISWQQAENLTLNFHGFRVWNDDFLIDLNGQVINSEASTFSDVELALEQVRVNQWKKYVPQQILSDDFREWSKGAFLQGVVDKGTLKLKGDLAQFPFHKQDQQGEFKFDLDTQGMELHFGEGWPNLKNVNAVIHGDEHKLTIMGDSGTIADVGINQATTIIERYLVDKPVLTTKGSLTGTTQQALNFLKVSPLKARFGEITELLKAKGTSDIDLNLLVPLTNVNSALADGFVKFNDTQLDITQDIGLRVNNINGKLFYNNDGVEAKGIKGKLFAKPIVVDVSPTNTATLVEVRGKASVNDVNKQWDDLLPNFFVGETNYLAGITIFETQPGKFDLTVNVQSNLTGVDIKMPAPLGKHATDIRPFSIDIKAYKQTGLHYQIDYDRQLNVALAVDENVSSGEVRLGGAKASLPQSGFALKGVVPELDLDDWLNWQASLETTQQGGAFTSLDTVSLNIDKLAGLEQNISNLALVAERAAQDWRVNIHSDQIKGRINWPIDQQTKVPASFDFDYVHFNLPQSKLKLLSDDKRGRLWPSVNFFSRHVQIDDMKLGEVSLLATRQNSRWIVDAGILKSDTINASVKGYWEQTTQQDLSQFMFKASSRDLKGFLADLGYQQVIEADKIDVTLDVNWDGSPTAFARENLIGDFNISVKKGKLIEVEPGAAGRIFGLMSIATIPRRLALDFSDLFSKGFHFQSIVGDFKLDKGIATTDNLSMLGDSATIDVTGPVNMIDKTYNQTVTVTPNVSSALPVAGAVAGGPVGLGVGAALLLADKLADSLFGKEIVNVISYRYALTGPWDEPELTAQRTVTE